MMIFNMASYLGYVFLSIDVRDSASALGQNYDYDSAG